MLGCLLTCCDQLLAGGWLCAGKAAHLAGLLHAVHVEVDRRAVVRHRDMVPLAQRGRRHAALVVCVVRVEVADVVPREA